MKTIIALFAAAFTVTAAYFGVRYITHKDLGFTPAKTYANGLAQKLLHTELTAAQEVGTTSQTA